MTFAPDCLLKKIRKSGTDVSNGLKYLQNEKYDFWKILERENKIRLGTSA